MAKLATILGRLLGRSGTPQAPKLPREAFGGGHRGIAAGSLKPGQQDLSKENVAQWRMLSTEELKGFIYEGATLHVHSTNVGWGQYNHAKKELTIHYKGDGTYVYSNVSEEEALQFAKAPSKGGFCWDVLRVRGSKTAHRKAYRKIG